MLRPDVAFLLYAARRVLEGARLYVDVVEINPPLIVVVNSAAVLLARLLHASDIAVYRLLVLLTVLASTWAGALLLGRVVTSPAQRRWLVLGIAVVLLPLPGGDFGEREHLLLAALLPYVWLVALRSEKRAPRSSLAASIGVATGLGLALKPHFLITWLALELYRRLKVDRRIAAPAPESTAVLAVLFGYGLLCILLTPQYFAMVGSLAGAYDRFLREPFAELIVRAPGTPILLLAVLTYVALRSEARHPALWDVLLVASVTLFMGGLLQQKGLHYHFYPALAASMLVLSLAGIDVPARLSRRTARIYRVVATATVCSLALTAVGLTLRRAFHPGWGARRDVPFAHLVERVRELAGGGSVLVLSYNLGSTYPLANYAHVESASRFPHLWLLAAEYLDRLHADAPLRYRSPAEMSARERYLLGSVVADFAKYDPKLIVVLRNARDDPMNGLRRLDYLAYFGRDPRFARLLRNYQWSEAIGEYELYRRLAPGEARTQAPPAATAGTRDVLVNREIQFLPRRRKPYVTAAIFLLALALATAFERRRARKAAAGL